MTMNMLLSKVQFQVTSYYHFITTCMSLEPDSESDWESDSDWKIASLSTVTRKPRKVCNPKPIYIEPYIEKNYVWNIKKKKFCQGVRQENYRYPYFRLF